MKSFWELHWRVPTVSLILCTSFKTRLQELDVGPCAAVQEAGKPGELNFAPELLYHCVVT
jgi:hypothetical protein